VSSRSTCSTTTLRLLGQHFHCPYQRRPCRCLAGGFHSSSCHCSLSHPKLIPLFPFLCFPRRNTYPLPTLQVGRSIQRLYKLSQMVTLISFDIEGAWAGSFFANVSHARCLFPSPPPLRPTDEGAVSAVLDKRYTKGKGETTIMGNDKHRSPGGGAGVVIHGISPQPCPYPPGRVQNRH
jgi:hypothetical protein